MAPPQVHFVVLQRNGVAVPAEKLEFLDSITVPYWNGTGPYPSAKVEYRWLEPFFIIFHQLSLSFGCVCSCGWTLQAQ